MRISKQQWLFLLLQGITAFASVLVGKGIASYYKPEEYGSYFIVTNLVSLYAAVMINPVIQAYRHLYYKSPDVHLFKYFRSFFFWQTILLGIVLLILGLAGMGSGWIFVLAFLQIVVTSNSNLQMANINIQGRINLQSAIQALSPFLNLGFLLVFALILSISTYDGIWWSMVIAEAIVVVLAVLYFKPHRNFEILSVRFMISGETLGMIFRFARPLLILPLFVWTVNNVDRYLLDYFYSAHEVGIYSAAYGLASKIFLIAGGALITYLNPSVYKQMADPHNVLLLFRKTMNRLLGYFAIGLMVVLVFYLLHEPIGHILLSDDYTASFGLLPVLALANLIFTALFIPEQAIYASGKTKYVLWHYVVGAISNVLLNLLLIPMYGVWGAAWAMVASSSIQVAIVLILFYRFIQQSSFKA